MNAPRILVVEDERLVAREIAESLQDLGYEVPATAATADEALELAQRENPDLVLLDIRIRGARDGVDAAALLRSRFGIPIIYLTACTDTETLRRASETEPYAYLVKPVKSVELRSAVEVALHKSSMDRRVRAHGNWLWTTLQAIGDAVLSTDPEGKVTFMNPAAENITGWSASDAVGQSLDSVLSLFQESSKDPVESPLWRALRERRSVDLPPGTTLRKADGQEIAIEDSAAPIANAEGKLTGAVMVFRDVTEQRRLRQQLELNDRLAALGTMAAGVAHEVNNPLSFILGNQQYAITELSSLLAELSGLPEALREALEGRVHEISAALADAQSGAERVRRIVSELGRLARPGVERQDRIDLRKCLDAAIAMTLRELTPRARLVREFGECPEVLADDTRITQVFVNLLVNAAHAIAPGRSESNEVRVVTGTFTGGKAYVEIRDTGCGIPKNVIPRVFEPFFTTRALETGTGLGLSVSHGIVQSLRGSIEVESTVGRGSTFRVVLPAADSTKSVPPLQGHSSVRPPAMDTIRVLLIDDERILLESLARTLEERYAVTTSTSARGALTLLENGECFDLIISDLMMPGMTGMEFYRELEQRFPEQSARTVFMTGGAFTPGAQQFLSEVRRRLLEKPFSNSQLLSFIAASVHDVSRA